MTDARAHGEAEVVDREAVAVALGQSVGDDHGGSFRAAACFSVSMRCGVAARNAATGRFALVLTPHPGGGDQCPDAAGEPGQAGYVGAASGGDA